MPVRKQSRDRGVGDAAKAEDAALAEDFISLFDSDTATDVNDIDVFPDMFPINLAKDCILSDSDGANVDEIAASMRVPLGLLLADITPSSALRLTAKLEEDRALGFLI